MQSRFIERGQLPMGKIKARRISWIIAVFALIFAGTANAESLTFLIQSEHPNIVSVEFYSQSSKTSWPGDGEVYIIDTNQVHSYPLSCDPGELICFGAWVKGDSNTYWGAGPNGKEACSDCCYRCEGGETPIRVLK
jgi:3',5'-cyclic AMP phosphodiesterase CpdA